MIPNSMNYEPIKQILSNQFNRWPVTRKVFYALLDLFLLRTWHIKKSLRKLACNIKFKESVDVLDAGSGFGQYTYFMTKSFPSWKILGVDLKKDEIDSCERFFKSAGIDRVRFQEADLTSFRKKQAFDIILSVDVMEHIEDDVAVFNNFYASLKENGLLLINTPSDRGGSNVHDPGQKGFIGEHVRNGYRKDEMEQKLRHAGFSKINIRYTYGIPGNVSWHLTMKFPMVCLSLSKWFFLVMPIYFLVLLPIILLLNLADLAMKHRSGTGLLVKASKTTIDGLKI
jgi:SAM-dependent methyltransferase